MKRFLTMALVGALILGAGSVAYANICAFDPAPAATLLFPFVAYNYDKGASGVNTLMAITNVSSDAQIAHVTVWTDYSVAILDFNILLTGYDVQTMDIRTILATGQLPVTWNDDFGGGQFMNGPWSATNELVTDDFPTGVGLDDPVGTNIFAPYDAIYNPAGMGTCSSSAEAYPGKFFDNPIPGSILALFETWLTASQAGNNVFNDCQYDSFYGRSPYDFSLPGSWFSDRDMGDDTWMYLTVDVVSVCMKSFPDNPRYFVEEATTDNVLIGDVAWVDNSNRFSEMDNAVHLEADMNIAAVASENPDASADGLALTFYSRYANYDTGTSTATSDYREALPTAWGFRYTGGVLGDGTELKTYIRTFKTAHMGGWDAPDQVPDLEARGLPASTLRSLNCIPYTYYAWDEDENVISAPERDPWSRPDTSTLVVPNLLPLETQEVDATQFDTVDDNGWFMFIWPRSNFGVDENFDYLFYQTWMGVKYVKTTDYSGFRTGAVLANFNCFAQQTMPYLGIDFPYVSYQDGYYEYTHSSWSE